MTVVLQFVESMFTSARLDLHSGPWSVKADGTSFDPPELRRAMSGTLMFDGENVSADAFGNREIVLRLEVTTSSVDGTAAEMQKLYRELARPRNMLKYLPHTSTPVWFKTYRAGPDAIEVITEGKTKFITARIIAEPFAYGANHAPISSVNINMDPAAGSNGMFVDITGVKGDVESPAQLAFLGGQIPGYTSAVAVRRRGTPSAMPFVKQAESMTQGTDTATSADALFSGGSRSRCSFGTTSMQTRLSTTSFPDVETVDARGFYRVFARVRRTQAADVINIQLNNNAKVTTLANTNINMLELGEVTVPGGTDPVEDGPSGRVLAAKGAGLTLKAERVSGTGSLDIDFLLFFPADNETDRFMIVKWPTQNTGIHIFDGYSGWVYNADGTTGAVLHPEGGVARDGLPIMLTPNQTNRLFFVRKIDGQADALTDAVLASISYYPRYIDVAPVGS